MIYAKVTIVGRFTAARVSVSAVCERIFLVPYLQAKYLPDTLGCFKMSTIVDFMATPAMSRSRTALRRWDLLDVSGLGQLFF